MKLNSLDLKKLVLEEIEKTKKIETLKEKKAKLIQEISSLNEDEDTEMPMDGGDEDGEHENYMFFSNLKQIKMMAEKLLALDKDEVDEMLSDGHDWAQDHISTSKDDIEEVCNFFKVNLEDEEEGEKIDGETGGEIDFDVTETGDNEELGDVEDLEERKLTKKESKTKEDIVMALKDKMKDFEKRYGKERAKEVMYATATKMAKEKSKEKK